MALVEQVSESEVVVRNTAFKWTLAWAFFLTVLWIPAIFCLVVSQSTTEQGGQVVPVFLVELPKFVYMWVHAGCFIHLICEAVVW